MLKYIDMYTQMLVCLNAHKVLSKTCGLAWTTALCAPHSTVPLMCPCRYLIAVHVCVLWIQKNLSDITFAISKIFGQEQLRLSFIRWSQSVSGPGGVPPSGSPCCDITQFLSNSQCVHLWECNSPLSHWPTQLAPCLRTSTPRPKHCIPLQWPHTYVHSMTVLCWCVCPHRGSQWSIPLMKMSSN